MLAGTITRKRQSQMPKIQVSSDLHLEYYFEDHYNTLLDNFKGNADILVIAGDFIPMKFSEYSYEKMKDFCDRYSHVVYVPGNHEYYGSRVFEANKVVNYLKDHIKNLTVLENSAKEIMGQKFYGGTMWFRDLPGNIDFKQQLNDFRFIDGFQPWVYEQNTEFIENFAKNVDPNTIVVTHHLPSYNSVPAKWRGVDSEPSVNRFFVCEMGKEIEKYKPKIWIHGHTHTPTKYSLDSTMILCNPYGYPNEKFMYDQDMILDQ